MYVKRKGKKSKDEKYYNYPKVRRDIDKKIFEK